MKNKMTDYSRVSVRLAMNANEVYEAQKVRYKVFYEEYGATPSDEMQSEKRDFDCYDEHADHLVVVDGSSGQDKIVGTYRLLPQCAADLAGGFYSADEFDIQPLLKSGMTLLELGRSCVLEEWRAKQVLQLLWQGIADYITDNKIDLMFGCASLHGKDPQEKADLLSYMHHYHLASEKICPRAVDDRYVDMNLRPKESLNAKRLFASLPPILKGYFRVGGCIGDGAVVDEQFNTIDVLIMVETASLTQRYKNHYERKMNKTMSDKTVSEG